MAEFLGLETILTDGHISVSFSPDGNYIAYGFSDGGNDSVHIRSTSDWSLIATFTEPKDALVGAKGKTISFSPDGKYLANVSTKDYKYVVNIRSTSDWSLIATLTESQGSISLAFSPDGKYLAYGGRYDNNIYIHSTSDWSLATTLKSGEINSLDYSPDGKYLAYGGEYGNDYVYVRSTSDWSLVIQIPVYPLIVAFSPDGKYLAYSSYGGDDNIYINSTSDWSWVATLTNATDWPYALTFSPDGNYIVYDGGGKVYVHKISDWSLVDTFTGLSGHIPSVSFSPDGKYLAYGDWYYNEVHIRSEGFLDITGIDAPESAEEGDTVNFTIYTKNTGGDDDFLVELTGDYSYSESFYLSAGGTKSISGSFVMPNYNVSINVSAAHYSYISKDYILDESSTIDIISYEVGVEGLLDITGVTAPESVHAGEEVDFTIHTKNTKVDEDIFKVELSGGVTGSQTFSLVGGGIKDVGFSFTMPNKDISITANTYHFEGDQWVWDISSTWDLSVWW